MTLSFSFPQLGQATGGAVATNPDNFNEESLRRVGIEFASNNLPNDHMFSRMGGWNVTFRASITRITFFKLLGLGLAAAFMATSPHVGAFTSWSLTMSAAINLVACYHYNYIWNVRAQTYRLPKYDKWMAHVGRAPAEDKALFAAEQEHDKRAVFFQEVTVDGLRYSDWLVTLVLLTLDLGHLREYLYYATGGVIPEMPIAKEWVASLQAIMMLFASVWRFYCNEGRSILLPDGSYKQASFLTVAIAWISYLLATATFVVIVWALLDGLPDDASMDAAMFPSHIKADVFSMRILVLVWIGYPVVTLAARLGHRGLPGDYYSATISTFKDLSFAFLDVTSKSGLTLYFVLKASWVSGAVENSLVAAGKAALNVTV